MSRYRARIAAWTLGLLLLGESILAQAQESGERVFGNIVDANTQCIVGDMYATGNGVTKDYAEAVKWYRKAAEQGYAEAQNNLGVMYATGGGVSKDSAEAVKWYQKAAEQGIDAAQYNLGAMYANGYGVAIDGPEAVKWYRRAANQGYLKAENNLGDIFENGRGVPKDYVEAAKWFRLAADRGDSVAECNLGVIYANGYGIPMDKVEAVKWYRIAANHGIVTAQGDLGVMYFKGEGVAKNEIEGLAWTYIAAGSGTGLYVNNRGYMETLVGHQIAIVAQQRSEEILKEISSTTSDAKSPALNESSTAFPPSVLTLKVIGSGAIVSAQGLVLTASHVVKGAANVKVYTSQGLRGAKVLRIDEANDIAIMQLDVGTYAALPVAPSRHVRLGQTVATIGFPNVDIQGFSPKVTKGEISSLNGAGDDPRSWQISVPIQPGNSGGPLLDENGNLVGIVESKLSVEAAKATNDLPQNVSYAVKSTYALALLEPYLDNNAAEPNQSVQAPRFEDMVARAQQSVVLILVY